MVMGNPPPPQIPLFVVGYSGWKNIETLKKKLAEEPTVSGILVIDQGLFVSQDPYGLGATGPIALWGLIVVLHHVVSGLKAASIDVVSYAR
jgi:hypothetical protein